MVPRAAWRQICEERTKRMYLISSCLLGANCKYNGGNNFCQEVADFRAAHSCCGVCPEAASGLPMPRPPAERIGDRIIDKEGKDVTSDFENGSTISLLAALQEAQRRGEEIEGAVLKANSPSCGSGKIYDGNFDGTLVDGWGCFAAKLRDRGIKVISEKEIKDGKF